MTLQLKVKKFPRSSGISSGCGWTQMWGVTEQHVMNKPGLLIEMLLRYGLTSSQIMTLNNLAFKKFYA